MPQWGNGHQHPAKALQQCASEQRHRLNHAKDMLGGHQQEIQTDRDRKLNAARQQRKNRRQRPA